MRVAKSYWKKCPPTKKEVHHEKSDLHNDCSGSSSWLSDYFSQPAVRSHIVDRQDSVSGQHLEGDVAGGVSTWSSVSTQLESIGVSSTDGKATAIMPMVLVSGRSPERRAAIVPPYGRRYFFVQA
jgi:hypothetical protein